MRDNSVSLKSRLLLWLIVPLVIMAIALVAESYFSARKSIEEIHDRMMVALAWSISDSVVQSGGDLLSDQVIELLSFSTNEKLIYQVIGPDNSFITGHAELPHPPLGSHVSGGLPLFYNASFEGVDMRMMAIKFLIEGEEINGWVQVRVAQTRTERESLLVKAVLQSALRITLVILLATLLAIIGVNRSLAPLTRLSASIQKRSYQDLRPINKKMPAELEDVVFALNNLLYRLDDSIESQRRFISNASHQLRTPLAALQAEAELAQREKGEIPLRQALSNILKGTKQTSRLAKQLLSLTSVRSNPKGANQSQPFDLVALAKSLTLSWVTRFINQDKDLGFETYLDDAQLMGSEFQVKEMMSNLIENALHYGGDIISVRICEIDGNIVFEVEDNGPGIPAASRQKVFERFVRLDERSGEGCGLGLDIAREIALNHDARIELSEGEGSLGLLVRVSFLKVAKYPRVNIKS